MPIMTLAVDPDPHSEQTLDDIRKNTFSTAEEDMENYRCENCDERGNCTKTEQVVTEGDVMIYQLKIYTEDANGKTKIKPKITIDKVINHGGEFDLKRIIWHHGKNWDSGHYTADVKINDTWYNTNDTEIKVRQSTVFKSYCNTKEEIYEVPYIIVYERRNNQLVPFVNTPAATSTSTANTVPSNDYVFIHEPDFTIHNEKAEKRKNDNFRFGSGCNMMVFLFKNCKSYLTSFI